MSKPKIALSPTEGSKSVESMGYDEATGTLHVRFKNGHTYEHKDVPLEKYAAFTGADSIGKFYNTKIRNAYPAQKLK